MAPSSHFGDELQDFLDGRLDEPKRSRVEEHLATCDQCRRELEALRWLARDVLGTLPAEEVPSALAARVGFALDAVDSEARRGRATRRSLRRVVRWAAAGTLLIAAALAIVLVSRPPSVSVPGLVARDFVAYGSGRIPIGVEARDPRAIEEFFARNGIGFTTRVFDLGMMRYTLIGGSVHRVGSRLSALFAYRGPDDRLLVCQMYLGSVTELPPPDEIRENNGITFHVHREGNTTLVFWQEGDVVCVLASDASPDAVIQLAYAKATRI